MSVHWYCLYTKPQKEAQVAKYCAEHLGLETYFPRLREQRIVRRQRKLVTGPLFPRYMFCRFELSAFYRAVRYAPEAANVVCAGNAPAVVADELIEGLRLWAGDETDVITLRPALRSGDTVEVVAGPLQGLSGIILSNCERDRVRILLRFLECGAQITVSRAEVKLIA